MRAACPDISIDLKIVSAGYGLLDEETPIVPYEMTFSGMKIRDLREWADFLELPKKVVGSLSGYQLTFVLLGKEYIRAVAFPSGLETNGLCVFLTGKGALRYLPSGPNIFRITLDNSDASRLGAGLVALKGRVFEILGEHAQSQGEKLLKEIKASPGILVEILRNYERSIEPRGAEEPKRRLLPTPSSSTTLKHQEAATNISHTFRIPNSWWKKGHRQKMMYFIPEWDDLVNPHYEFLTDTHPTGTSDSYESAIYAHQIYDAPQYDGILISKVVAEKKKSKKANLQKLGVHKYLRVPRGFPIMGDCGAFGYIVEEVPPYETEEILDYYQSLDFDFGVSIDHLIVKAILKKTIHYLVNADGKKHKITAEEYEDLKERGEANEVERISGQLDFIDRRPLLWKDEIVDDREKLRRYELTINNARDFIEKHKNRQRISKYGLLLHCPGWIGSDQHTGYSRSLGSY
jgi:hypothetical protein